MCRLLTSFAAALVLVLALPAAGHGADRLKGCDNGAKAAQLAASSPSNTICTKPVLGTDTLLDAGKCIGSVLSCAITEGGDAVGGVAGDVASAVGGGIIEKIATEIAQGVAKVVTSIQRQVQRSTTPKITSAWFKAEYFKMLGVSAVIALIALMASVLTQWRKGDHGAPMRALCVDMPTAIIGSAIALGLVQLLITMTDQLTIGLTQGFEKDLGDAIMTTKSFADKTGAAPVVTLGAPLALFVGLLTIFASLAIWVELAVREAAIYIVMLFVPLAWAMSIMPMLRQVMWRMGQLLLVVILSKLVISVIFGLGATVIAKAGGPGGDGASGMVAGMAMMFLAAFVPTAILGLVALNAGADVPGRNHMPGPSQAIPMAQKVDAIRRGFGGGGSSGGGKGGGPTPVGPKGAGGGGASGAGSTGGGGGGAAAAGGPAAAAAAAGLMAAKAGAHKARSSAEGVAAQANTARPEGQGLSGSGAQMATPSAKAAAPSKSPAKAGPAAPQGDTALPAPSEKSTKEKKPTSTAPHMAGRGQIGKLRGSPNV